jgi:putative flippase GtrA
LSGGRGAGPATQSLTGIYQRFRQLIHEGAKFGIVGGIGVIVVLAGSDALHFELHLGKFTSVTIATVFATVATFLGNRYWSFRHRRGGGAGNETILFFVLNGVGLLIQYACIGAVTDLMGLSARIWYTVANLVGIGIGTLFRFWSYRKWIWVTPEAYLAKLRRGRHRKGRTTPVPPAPSAHPQSRSQDATPVAGRLGAAPVGRAPLPNRPVRHRAPDPQPHPRPHAHPHPQATQSSQPTAQPMLAARHLPANEDPRRWTT